MKAKKLYVVLVGLPARGKSTIGKRLRENLVRDSIRTRIFNNGDLRRKMISENTSYPGFFDPDNEEGAGIREKIALINMGKARDYLQKRGHVAILDATNISLERRKKIRAQLNDHPILFIECINNDEDILEASILRKVAKPEFDFLTREEAYQSFKERISYYLPMYTPMEQERNFIKLDSLNNKILQEEKGEGLPHYDQIRDFLVTDTVKSLYLVRHSETYFNLEDRIGGDSELTEGGKSQAGAMAAFFKTKKIPLIFTSLKQRTIQTAEPIRDMQPHCTLIPLAEFNEIDAGVCECKSYEEIATEMPQVYSARKRDKYNYVYPEGEGYITMRDRIGRGIKKALYLSDISSNIMIIGHRATNRMILSHFLFRRQEDVPYIYVPQDKFYLISITQNKKLFQLKGYQ